MKSLFLNFSLLLCSALSFAQQVPLLLTGNDRYKKVSGRYGGNDGICLFEDGTFMLYGYATAVFGHYSFEKDYLLFYPDKPELFEVYGTQNKSIGKQTKINFVDFEGNGRSFLQLDKAIPRQVFNDNANCFDAPFVAEEAQIPQAFMLSAEESDNEPPLAANAYQYENAGDYNDFIFVYHPPKRHNEPFSASLYKEGKEHIVIKLSNYGGDKGYWKNDSDEEEQKQWQEILEMKNQYDASKEMIKEGVMANEHYHTFWRDMKTYKFDSRQNIYVSKTAQDNEDYFRQDLYNDDRYLRRFVLLQPKAKIKTDINQMTKSDSSIFFTVCGDGAENAYRYKALHQDEAASDTIPLQETTAPVPIESAKP